MNIVLQELNRTMKTSLSLNFSISQIAELGFTPWTNLTLYTLHLVLLYLFLFEKYATRQCISHILFTNTKHWTQISDSIVGSFFWHIISEIQVQDMPSNEDSITQLADVLPKTPQRFYILSCHTALEGQASSDLNFSQ